MRQQHLRVAGVVINNIMLTLPDLREKQIVFIRTEQGLANKIKIANENIVFLKDDKVVNRVSCHKALAVFIVGDISITSRLIREGLQYGVSFFLLKSNFDLYASLCASAEANYAARMKQYAIAEPDALALSKQIVKNKIENQCALLRERGKTSALASECQKISQTIARAENQEELLGLEGSASKKFFEEYFSDIGWRRRAPRAKPDIPNFLLDMGYTFLFNFVDALLRLHGFDTYKGFYHKLFFQRKSLTCDMVEPFRCVIDKELLKAYNLGQIKPDDFSFMKNQCSLGYEARSRYAELFMDAIMQHKEDMYKFIQGFYRAVMRGEHSFDSFTINKK
jgi:CRISP-associated protein Cas1